MHWARAGIFDVGEQRDMDNFHIYEEIGSGKKSTVFKGRRKRSVEYVAIKSIDKEGTMPKILHEVQQMYRLSTQLPKVLSIGTKRETISGLYSSTPAAAPAELLKEDRRLPEEVRSRIWRRSC